MEVKLVHPLNVPSSILIMLSSEIFTSFKPLHPVNAPRKISFTLLGMVIEVKPVQ